MKRKILSVILAAALLVTMLPMSAFEIKASAASYFTFVESSSEISHILNMIESRDGSEIRNKISYLFYDSDFSAVYHGEFPYPNSGSSTNQVTDNGKVYTLAGRSRGCYLYADYVSKYVYNMSSHQTECVSIYICDTAGKMTATQVKDTVQKYAQAGEHILINGNVHSVAFLAYTDSGFYHMDYMNDANPKIYIKFSTYEQFANRCNNAGQRARLLDMDRSVNDGSSSDSTDVSIVSDYEKNTITDTNAILYAMVYKPSSYAVTKIGIKVRKDGSTYDNGWSVYQNPSKSYVGNTSMQPYFNMNTELGATLVPGTKYWLQFYAVVNGKEYWSPEYYFSTTGSPYTLTIKYDSNGGIISSDKYEITSDGLVKRLSDNSTKFHVVDYNEYDDFYNCGTFGLTKNGYKFAGWTVEDGSTVYDMNKSWYPEEIYPDLSKGSTTITAKAVWIPNTLTISYNANGGTISSDLSNKYYIGSDESILNVDTDTAYTQTRKYGVVDANGFVDDTTLGVVKEGHTFVGWSLAKEGSTVYTDTETWKPESVAPALKDGNMSIVMYAIWKSKDHVYDNACDPDCNVCGETRETQHSYVTTIIDATCTTEGKNIYTCKECGYSYEEITAYRGHVFADYEYYSEEYHKMPCYYCDFYFPASHTWEYYENVEATCETDGYYHKYCTVCKGELEGTVDALGHSYDSVVTLPTTTSQGYTTYTCTVCGDSYKDNYTPALVANGVKNMQVTATDTSITVTWDALDGATKYNLYVNDAEGNNLITRALAADKTSVTLSWPNELEWDKNYTIGIRAKTTKWLDTVYKTAALTVADRIVDVKTQSVGRTIKVDWRAYESATQYYVYVYEKGAYPTTVTSVKATTNSATIINAINPEVDYEVRVIATKGVAKMATVDALSIDARLKVFTPDTFTERGITPTKVGIGFDEVRGADKYWVYLTPVEGGETIVKASDRAIAAVSGLAPNTTYNVQLQSRIVDTDGVAHYSGMSETLGTITTTEWEDINFTATATENGAKLTWTAPTNAYKYIIYRSTNGGKSYKAIAAITDGTTSCVDTAAKNGYMYAIKVQLQDDFVTTAGSLIKSEAIVK